VAFSTDVAPGAAIAQQAFGHDLVVWRTTDGSVRVQDAVCPHLGAHLGHGGRVEGDSIQCPFHGWRYDDAGVCVSAPHAAQPPRVCVPTWPVVEQDGVVLAWNDSAGREPSWSMPAFGDADDAEENPWTDDVVGSWRIRSHPQEVCENSADVAHFQFVHRSQFMAVVDGPSVDGPVLRTTIAPRDGSSGMAPLVGEVHGPGLVLAFGGGDGYSGLYRLYVTPIDGEHVELRGMVRVQTDEVRRQELHRLMADAVFAEWEADVPIWEHKAHIARPPLLPYERAILTFRRWYGQFYD
jgi:nitrite reductase/ring-hydroxylating ferredoxin subunit